MDQNIVELLARRDWPVVAGLMFSSALWGALWCLFGYTILRLALLVQGLFLGIIAGVLAACAVADYRQIAAGPSGLDFLIACSAGALLLALASWILYRLALGLAAGTAVCCVAALQFGQPPTPAGWVVGGLAGLALAAGLIVYTRPLVIFLSAVGGACMAVYWAAALIAQDEPAFRASVVASPADPARIAPLAGAAIVLAAIGVFTQTRLRALFLPAAAAAPSAEEKAGDGEKKGR